MSAKILVIDDEESMCNFMEIMLAKEGYSVETASSGKDSIDHPRNAHDDIANAVAGVLNIIKKPVATLHVKSVWTGKEITEADRQWYALTVG